MAPGDRTGAVCFAVAPPTLRPEVETGSHNRVVKNDRAFVKRHLLGTGETEAGFATGVSYGWCH